MSSLLQIAQTYTYAGYTNDVENVLNEMQMLSMSILQRPAGVLIYNNNYLPVMKDERVIQKNLPCPT
jgi:hypothetical protein